MQTVLRRMNLQRPTIAATWHYLTRFPGGNRLFSKFIGRMAPYTGSIDFTVQELDVGHAVVTLNDRRSVRNHLNSIHAIALMNLGEVSTGLAVLYSVDGRGRGIVKSLKMDYEKKARGTLTATCDAAVPLIPGSQELSVEGLIRDDTGEVVARVTALWKLQIDA